MIPPKMYSLESYEPDILRPDEINHNRDFNKLPLSDKNLPRLNFLPESRNVLNLNIRQIVNNNQHIRPQIIKTSNNIINTPVVKSSKTLNRYNNNILQIKYPTNNYTLMIPTIISMKNPYTNKTIINPKYSNKILNSNNFTNPFLDNKITNIKYITQITNKNVTVNHQNNAIPHFNPKIYIHNNIRSKSHQNVNTYNQFHTMQTNNISVIPHIMPIYRRIVYRKKK